MGFHLDGLFTIDGAVLTLYDRVVPGAARLAVRARGQGLPPGWVLPWPDMIQWLGDGTVQEVPVWFAAERADEWRAACGAPGDPAFEDVFHDDTVRLASLLSLATPAGVVIVDDHTFGGVLDREFAAAFVRGRLVAASGIDHFGKRAYSLDRGRFEIVESRSVDPVASCAAVLDQAFSGAFLFDGYLPRSPYGTLEGRPAEPDAGAHHPLRVPNRLRDGWVRFFPVLAR
ncbi:hypothetical protein DPM19_31085 [Actinomadura craniellae]|uniref:Uncharacterized protein n=1 Tax=Actinomadura craniellae TaxID=2231787 RepID=A0A365GWM2_9ACTN|nr:hypothetical protein [Actinomadura craniellae]RAY11206.1 hypothetical protein DPM19_31085 [Actinomadura craniellae]